MSSVTIEHPAKVDVANKKENENHSKTRKMSVITHKKTKHEENRHSKFGRKRLQSFTNNGKFFPPYKRRKKEGAIIPPTKFLLGGNICDPLNLNSMQDEEVNRALNAVTPKSSPLPTPKHRKEIVELIIPPNIHDPLNLINCNDDEEYEKQLISPVKKTSKKKKKNKKNKRANVNKNITNKATEIKDSTPIEEANVAENAPDSVAVEPEKAASPSKSPVQETQPEKKETTPKDKVKLKLKGLEESKDLKRLRKCDSKDKIVSPVVPQPGAWKPRLQHRSKPENKKKKTHQPKFNAKNARFQYGNYNRYYGYRNPHNDLDTRLQVFSQRKELFFGKDILDIGCNIGHITLSVARDFGARSITGIDIDKTLINIARKNVKHYVNCVQSPASTEDGDHTNKEYDANYFPVSMLINYGPVDIPGFTKHNDRKGFPYNVTFVQGNYVLEDDALLSLEQPQFDTILCLSITKWIHLNNGDAGLKQSFKRMYAQLRPGGVLVLEPQHWHGYSKKKLLTEQMYEHYKAIEFFPHKFTQYLLSSEVGFLKCEMISVPPHPSRGFQRPIYLYTKPNTMSTPSASSVANATSVREEETIQTIPLNRNERRISYEQLEQQRREYEKNLFPTELGKSPWTPGGNLSSASQRSGESLSQYEHFENVYAPSATPCYSVTPIHTIESNPMVDKMCYLDVKIEHNQVNSNEADKKPSGDNQDQLRPENEDQGEEKDGEEDKQMDDT